MLKSWKAEKKCFLNLDIAVPLTASQFLSECTDMTLVWFLSSQKWLYFPICWIIPFKQRGRTYGSNTLKQHKAEAEKNLEIFKQLQSPCSMSDSNLSIEKTLYLRRAEERNWILYCKSYASFSYKYESVTASTDPLKLICYISGNRNISFHIPWLVINFKYSTVWLKCLLAFEQKTHTIPLIIYEK